MKTTLLASVAMIGLVVSSAYCQDLSSEPSTNPERLSIWPENDVGPLVFYAVLEGLYTDGVSNEVVDKVIKPDFTANFIYSCPLCHPAYQAFLLYRDRQPFYGIKYPQDKPYDTFGSGLEGALKQDILTGSMTERRAAIQSLITRWVARRLEQMRLTPDELELWKAKFDQAKAKGTKALKSLPFDEDGLIREDGLYSGYLEWDECAVCEGAFGACEVREATMRSFVDSLSDQDD